MLLERYDFDGVKAHREGLDPLIVTNENARKAIFQKLNRSGGFVQGKGGNKRLTRRGLMRRGNSFAGLQNGQRVVVKIRYVKHKPGKTGVGGGGATALRDHLRYINRTGAGKDSEQAVLFNGRDDGADRKDFLTLCSDDRHHFRVIVSPENGHDIPDFHIYIRKVMALVEKDLGTKLEWMAAAHYDTEDPHAHVIVRGKTDKGEDLVIGQDYIKEGVRKRAQEVATELLGERTLDEIQKSLEKEVDALRVTSLDRFIDRQASAEHQVDVRKRTNFGKSIHYEGLIKGRLKFLGTAGLAQESPPGVYTLNEGYQDTLSQIARRNEVMKRLHNKVDTGLEGLAVYTLKDGEGPTVEGQVVTKGVEDELYDRKFIVVREPAGALHYATVNQFRRFDELQAGSLVKIHAGNTATGKADLNIAAIAAENDGIYDPARHLAHVEKHQSYIPAEDRAQYIEAHAVRLGTLEQGGAAEALGEGLYRVPADMAARGAKINQQMNEKQKKRFYPFVTVLSVQAPERQIDASKKTWLDKELYKQSTGKGCSALAEEPNIKAAIEERKSWLVRHDLALIQSNGEFALRDHALKRLDKLEIYAAGHKLAEKLGATFNDAQVKTDSVMRYEGFVTLETGVWAAVTRGKSLQLASVKSDPQFDRGASVLFDAGEGKALVIRAVGKDIARTPDKDQERGL